MLSSPGDINVKKLAFTPYCGVGGGGGGGGGRGRGKFIQTSTMTPLSATVSHKCVCVGRWGGGGGQWLQTHFTLTMCVGTCVRLITMEMSIDVK